MKQKLNRTSAKMKIGIIGAMEVEVQTLVAFMKECGGVREQNHSALKFYEGNVYGVNVVVVKSGIGKVNAAICTEVLISTFDVTHVINTGIAGALQKGLRVFDVVVSKDALYHDVDVTGFGYAPCVIPQMKESCFKADEMLIALAEKAFDEAEELKNHSCVVGRVATGDQFVSSVELKNKIAGLCNPSCVEMEGAAIAHACFLRDVPFVIIRTMSDMAEEGEESVYKFNEEMASKMSANLVREMIKELAKKT